MGEHTHAPVLAGRDLVFSYAKGRNAIEGATLEIFEGDLLAVVGPNGSGKSTLLRCLARLLKPSGGTVELDGVPLARHTARTIAHRLAVLPQSPVAPPGMSVRELVSLGRYSHRGMLARTTADDAAAIGNALDACGIAAFADRKLHALSGGERQRAWIAMALAQRSPILLLDEPVTALDVRHQFEVLGLLRDLNREEGRTVVAVLHDLPTTARYFDQIAVVHEGRVVARGAAQQTLTTGRLGSVFGVEGGWRSGPDGAQDLHLAAPTPGSNA